MRAVELFAGVGGFRLGLERSGHEVVWANQWEPATKTVQHAFTAYLRQFHDGRPTPAASNEDIARVDPAHIPAHDLLVGGFPCQDYSVQTTLDKSQGLQGKKGVLWWEIRRIAEHHRPPYMLLENVDRLLRSPAKQRGRDLGVILACLRDLDYVVEWRVLNAAEHGLPTRRRRVFLFAARADTAVGRGLAARAGAPDALEHGYFGPAFPVVPDAVVAPSPRTPDAVLPTDLARLSDAFTCDFQNAGTMARGAVWTRRVVPAPEPAAPIASVLRPATREDVFLPETDVARWAYQKGAKREERTAKNGHRYMYAEGPVAFPDPPDRPSRTILTGEGGRTPNRTTHIVRDPGNGKLRRLLPEECEALMGFHEGWTEGMPDRWRYFTMGNALVVDLVVRMGRRLSDLVEAEQADRQRVKAAR